MMSSSWRWKVWLTLASILLSLYVLTPTLLGWNMFEKVDPASLSTLHKTLRTLLPSKTLNLGLDLRGGMYVELEVSVEEAIQNRLDLIAGSLARFLKDKEKPAVLVERIDRTRSVRAILPSAESRKLLLDHVRDVYADALVEETRELDLTFRSNESEEAKLQAQHQEILKETAGEPSILDVTRASHSPLFRIVLKPDANAGTVRGWVTGKFPALKEEPEAQRLVLRLTDPYLEKLRSDSVKQAVETIRNRIDRYGVAEPSIRQIGESRVAVELPGVSDPDRAMQVVKSGGKLEFKMVDDTPGLDSNPSRNAAQNDLRFQNLVAEARTEKNIPEGYTAETVAQINEALKGKIPSDSEVLFEIEYDPLTKKVSGQKPYLIKRKVELTGDMLASAQTQISDTKGPYVSLEFNATGRQVFGDLTASNIGHRLAIILDGNVKMAPTIESAIRDQSAMITLGQRDYDDALTEAENMVLVLREGALPASLNEVTKTVVGPSLGKAVIHNSLIAAALAGLTVVVFMILYYKGSGLIADLVLGVNVLLILGVLALFQATLTLPGIAGIVLTMGMALDASIIIFERIREELKSGRPVRTAVEAGFSNAWTAVFDTHLTTFISGIVLYYFGTGPIRGFAVTLMVGVLTTFFTAYLTTKLIYEYLLYKVKIQKVSI